LKAHFLRPLLAKSGGPFILRNLRTGLPVATILELAFDSASRKRGLLGREGLPPGHALIIAPSSMVHTFFMRFPIDILVVARDGRVLKARRNVPSRRIVGTVIGFAAIELAANELDRSATEPGDRLEVASVAAS
jgi:uncharacterized membrane protein (UPF0127 family)